MGAQIDYLDSLCVQKAVYWHPAVSDGRGGYTFENVDEINVRWEDKRQVIRTSDGVEFVSKAKILLHSSTPRIDNQGYLVLAALEDLTQAQREDPKMVEGAFQPTFIERKPLFRSDDEFVRRVYL